MYEMFAKIAEARIREAIEKGELKDLPGEGKPIVFEDMTFVPPEMRAAFRLIKNAGLIPDEVALQKEIGHIQESLNKAEAIEEKAKLKKKMEETNIRLNIMLEKQRGSRK
jgi:hypothetical protein